MCLLAEAESSRSLFVLLSCSSVSDPSPSGLIPKAVDPFRAFTVFKVQSGLPFSPKSSQSSSLFSRAESAERQASLHRCSLGEDDSLSSGGLSSSCVALRLSGGGFPAGHGCSYTLNNTAAVVLQTAPLRSKDGRINKQFVLRQTCLRSLKWVDDQASSPSVC